VATGPAALHFSAACGGHRLSLAGVISKGARAGERAGPSRRGQQGAVALLAFKLPAMPMKHSLRHVETNHHESRVSFCAFRAGLIASHMCH